MAGDSSSENEDSDTSDHDSRVESLETLMEIMQVPALTRRSKITIIDTTLDSTPQKSYPAHEVLCTPVYDDSELFSSNGVKASTSLSAEDLILRDVTAIEINSATDSNTLLVPGDLSPNEPSVLNNAVPLCETSNDAETLNEIDSDHDDPTTTDSFPVGGTEDGTPPVSLNSSDLAAQPESDDTRENRGRTRNPVPDPKIWARDEAKLKRTKGEDYVGFRRKDKKSTKIMIHDTPKRGRTMGPVCPSGSKCGKWANRECHKIDESKRNALFVKFWHDVDWGEKKMYIASLVINSDPARKKAEKKQDTTPKKPPKPKERYSYYLKIDNKQFQVCRTTFLNTFGLKNSTVRYWLAEYAKIGQTAMGAHDNTKNNLPNREEATSLQSFDETLGGVEENQLSSHENFANKKKMLSEFLREMPKLPSHYCRQSSNRLYLQTDITSMRQLYNLYKEHCVQQQTEPLSRFAFDKKCKEMRLSIYSPKKDQCDLCTGYKHKNVAQETYDLHILLKNQAREQKNLDKSLAEEEKAHVLCCYVMAVKLLIPAIETSVAYYRMKLAIHNYTVYSLGEHDANCFWFVESECKLLSSVFATCLVEEIERLLSQRNQDVIIYSDGSLLQHFLTPL